MSISSQIETSRSPLSKLTLKSFFGRKGVLSQAHPNYEFRVGQLEMAEAVAEALAEAAAFDCGSGHRHRQDAGLSGSGDPFRQAGGDFHRHENAARATLLQRSAVLGVAVRQTISRLLHEGPGELSLPEKLYDADREPILTGLEEVREFKVIRDWEKQTQTGDRSELRDIPEVSSAWWKLDARSDNCAGQKCAQFDRCFITEMHRKAMASDIIIVNHHLFFADLAARDRAFGSILPDYAAVIFDEAHEIEDVAGQYFGMSVSNLQIQELVKDAAAVSRRKMFATPELDRGLIQLGDRTEAFFGLFPREGRQGFNQQQAFLARHDLEYRELLLALDTLTARLELVQGAVEDVLPLVRRAKLIREGVRFWLECTDPGSVYWVEGRGRGVYGRPRPLMFQRRWRRACSSRWTAWFSPPLRWR